MIFKGTQLDAEQAHKRGWGLFLRVAVHQHKVPARPSYCLVVLPIIVQTGDLSLLSKFNEMVIPILNPFVKMKMFGQIYPPTINNRVRPLSTQIIIAAHLKSREQERN